MISILSSFPRTRVFQLPITALLAVMLFGAPAFAESGGGGGRQISLKARYSQSQFVRLEAAEYNAGVLSARHPMVGGFSAAASLWLFQMAHADRRATQRLVCDMQKLKSKRTRLTRLHKEITKAEKLVANLKASVNRLKGKRGVGAKLALKSEEARLTRAHNYLAGVRLWRARPMEGTK